MRVRRGGRSRWRAAVLAVLVGGLLPQLGGPASASCAEDSGPAGSAIVFVGVAEAERRGYTRFAVAEVRKGPDLAPEVWVLSGQEQPPWPLSLFSAVSSSNDADFVAGERYVVGTSSTFAIGACAITKVDDDVRRPPDGRDPVGDGATGADPPMGPVGQTLAVVGVLGVAIGVIVLLRRRWMGGPRETGSGR